MKISENLISAVKEGIVPLALGAGIGAAVGTVAAKFIPNVPAVASALAGAVVGGGIGALASEKIVPGTAKTAIIGAALPVTSIAIGYVIPALSTALGGVRPEAVSITPSAIITTRDTLVVVD